MPIAIGVRFQRDAAPSIRSLVRPIAGLLCLAWLSACSQGTGESPPRNAATAPPLAEAEDEMTARITGSIAIPEGTALPDSAYAMVEVRNSAGPDAMPVVAEQRIDLKGAESPLAFTIAIDRMRIPMDIGFAFRAAIFVDGKPRHLSDQIPVSLAAARAISAPWF